MKYRVVQTSDGAYKCQYRVLPFVWQDSIYRPSSSREDQIEYPRFAERPTNRPAVTGVVWK